jgi:hypothetical protein
MLYANVRNYFQEKIARIRHEWKLFQQEDHDTDLTKQRIQDSDTRRHFSQVYYDSRNEEAHLALNAEYSTLVEAMRLDYQSKDQPFELSISYDTSQTPLDRIPLPGIKQVPKLFHSGHVIHANPLTSRPLQPDNETDANESYIPGDIDFGEPLHELLQHLITNKYPQYQKYVDKYCRPAGTTDATFRDFNKEQKPSAPINEERKLEVFDHIFHFLDCTPFLPIHFVDTQYAKLPNVTGTGYHNRFSYKQKAHAKYSHPTEYSDRPTSKGYFYNATYEHARTMIHKIKETGLPFNFVFSNEHEDPSTDEIDALIAKNNAFFDSYPTLLFTRNHISDRDGTLKVRPVYAVDDIFLIIETMLTFPLLVQARKPSCCIMYGLETIRGSNCYLDHLARDYKTFFTIDWSGYDQTLPRVITDLYYTDFLRRLIIISNGYAPTYEYDTYPDLTEDSMYTKMDNLLKFLHLWYNNMTFLSVDGFAYRRLHCGVPSGLYNTQYLDSFGNLFLLIDSMIEFGFTHSEIRNIILFVLGDDNSGFTNWTINRLHTFISFLEKYALERYNMVLSKTKSVITAFRDRLETLSYRCNNGMPRRPLGKLVAQLCFPEHGIRLHTMSMRAIGIAYASSGQDKTFHRFCQDVYYTFLPYRIDDERTKFELMKWMSSGTASLDDAELDFMLNEFPDIHAIHRRLSTYAGPLQYAPKWNYAHFIHDPDFLPPFPKTMHEYEIEHNIKVQPAHTFSLYI